MGADKSYCGCITAVSCVKFLDDKRAVLFAVLYKHFDGAAALTAVRGGEVKIDVICRVGKFDVFVALLRKSPNHAGMESAVSSFGWVFLKSPDLSLGTENISNV